MFFVTRFVFGLPLLFLMAIGEPFIWQVPSSMRQMSENDIKDKYYEAKINHYLPRVFFAFVFVALCMILGLVAWTVPEAAAYAITIIASICILMDITMLVGRKKHYDTAKKATGTDLVLQDHWKDTSLSAILKKRQDEVLQWENEHGVRRENSRLHAIS